ncbi:MAG: S8 family peptidase [Clostridiales bacterium]|nr:S8 family peptidase [Clostridiales bacterium]
MSDKHPILANGQYYIDPLVKRTYGGDIEYPHSYEDAKVKLFQDISDIQDAIVKSEETFAEQKVVCVRLEPKFEAKSYAPSSLVAGTDMKMIGGRKYKIDAESDEKGKLYFIRATNSELEELKTTLSTGKKDHVKKWQNQLCTIKSIDLLQPREKILGFPDCWQEGDVEVVLHPLGDEEESVINDFFATTGLQKEKAAIRSYDDGLTFMCIHMDIDARNAAEKYNPLRSIKPINDDLEDFLRMGAMVAPAPQLPTTIYKSDIKIGVFDGGVQKGTKLLDPFVNGYDMVNGTPTQRSLDHGAGVCSAILYGSLNGKTELDRVENPVVSVESFRVFPTQKTGDANADWQMYSTIDIIEDVVKKRKDIKLYSLSFGPKGAIIDDEINRFTYVCDKLTYDVDEDEENPLFCVAAGNDGKLEEPLNRVQSPADMVNGISVGSYTFNALGDKYRATYSCVGPGREGAKIKPDLLEFGGSMDHPFIALKTGNEMEGVQGTSYSAPAIAGKIGRLMAASEQIVPHLGRALLIHNAESDGCEGNAEEGFGYCIENVEEVLNCPDNKVTILYEGEITSSASVRLPIFMPDINGVKGTANVRWAICTVVNPNLNDPDAYTNNCIEDTFYPNEMKYTFRKTGHKDVKIDFLIPADIERAAQLLKTGYRKSDLPIPKPARRSFREADLRNSDFKWDTIIRKEVSMRCSSLLNPFLSLHAIGRDEYEHEKIKYFVVITVDAPNVEGSLYDNILQTYPELVPIQIQNTNRVMTKIE